MSKQKRTLEKTKTLQTLNLLERKNKFNSLWDNDVKLAFHISESISFEEMIIKDPIITNNLILKWK
jgi:hypothetical protein